MLDRDAKGRWSVGPAPKGGSGHTVNNNYRQSDGRVTLGVTWRMICDVGAWDACQTINSPGQSGDPGSPHYNDLFPLWAAETYVPLLYSDAAVDAATHTTIRLAPIKRS